MYVCIYTTTGASYPPHPMGGGCGNTGHGTIYICGLCLFMSGKIGKSAFFIPYVKET